MAIIFLREIETLKERVLRLSVEVEDLLQKALKAVAERDVVLAQAVIEGDARIDAREVDIEEECLKLLALHQPVASDLRFVIVALKVNNDLERIADLAVNIADRAQRLSRVPAASLELQIPRMSAEVLIMMREVFQAFMDHDLLLAAKVVAHDDVVDEMNREIIARVVERMKTGDESADALILLLGVSRELERIGDHATNIAEDLIYMFNGEIVRHHKDEIVRVSGVAPQNLDKK